MEEIKNHLSESEINELENLAINAYEEENLNFNPDVVINGISYFYSPAHQLANHICSKVYDEFVLTSEQGFSSAKIFLKRIIEKGGFFMSPKYGPEQCIGLLLYDAEKNQITLRKTNVKTDQHEFHADYKRGMDDCFGVSYEIFKYLRDSDLIQIHAEERQVRHKKLYIYTINKRKAAKNGRFLHFKGYGVQFFIPKADFMCVEKEIKAKRTRRNNVKKRSK